MQEAVSNPGPITFLLIFSAGLLTSLGPCSLSLMPITIAYIGGSNNKNNQIKILSFCGGIIFSLVLLGVLSGFFGKIYGQLPHFFTKGISVFAILMGLNLLGIIRFQLPNSPNFKFIENRVPPFLAPMVTGAAFGLASTPCITPVLASLLAWVSQTKDPIISLMFLFFFGLGQVIPLIIIGFTTESLKKLLEFRKYSQIIPTFSGLILISLGVLNLISNWI
mgnify:CR=1 FL=1|tara:strand:+ start:276 stop:938 length:663 start_codon:yes stop_codon:yes gene_type:complete